jgi:hypothetical protein
MARGAATADETRTSALYRDYDSRVIGRSKDMAAETIFFPAERARLQ